MFLACPGCRSVVPDEAKFCPNCGTRLVRPPSEAKSALSQALLPHRQVFDRRVDQEAIIDLGFGRVVVGALIGDGGMGSVYRGWLYFDPGGPQKRTPPTEVAVKMLHRSLGGRARVRKLFIGEAEALRRLSHPNIVRFYGLSESDGRLAIVMELVEGQALSMVIERQTRRAKPGGLPAMAFLRAWHYFQQLLGALAATHGLGIVHRDVKPANVLIRRDGFAKLTDFGIARLPADVAKTTGGLQPGTGAYMSPEQVLGKQLDGRSDLYSAAIVLYEMLTGRTPFEAPDRSEFMIRAAQVEETPQRLTELVPRAPPIIDALFARALAKNPAQRFSSAIEFGDAFRAALRLPDSMGWQAQQVLAGHAFAIAASPSARAKQGTIPVTDLAADAMRARVDTAYRQTTERASGKR
jgi:serine/threonine-protein kinase